MIDREKVIKGLECCTEDGCKDFPYYKKCDMFDEYISETLLKDVLEVLKEQEQEKHFTEWAKKNNAHVCATCGRASARTKYPTECPIEQHYALPLDGYCHLWEEVKQDEGTGH